MINAFFSECQNSMSFCWSGRKEKNVGGPHIHTYKHFPFAIFNMFKKGKKEMVREVQYGIKKKKD